MTASTRHDAWSAARSYEHYMGRWSRQIAARFVAWLQAPPGLNWLDIGCGTGALSAAIVERCAPASVLGVDPSAAFVEHARAASTDLAVRYEVAGADALPCDDGSVDVVVSALAYNFFPERAAALAEMRRVAKPGATVGFYVWDYPGGGMGFIDAFWKAAVAGGADRSLDETTRFPFCTREALRAEATAAGLSGIDVEAIEVPTRFADFEAFWQPFTLGAGPAPGYCMSLDEAARDALRESLQARLGGGPIELPARAWALRAGA